MHILLVTDSYPPEIRSASHLMLELAQELQRRGHEITVMTTWPEYNLDQAATHKTFNELENENGIRVIRIKTLPHHNVNYIIRGLSQLLMPLQFLIKLWRYKIKPQASIVYSPPLPLALVGSWLRRSGVRYLLNIQDLFPQNAIDLGILRSTSQIKFFKALERFAYRTADIVTVHSEGNRKMLLQQHPDLPTKFELLHNWVDVEHHSDKQVTVDFRKKWGITQKHIAVFAGVMGPSQYLDLILNIAAHMQDRTDLLFLMVGDGKEKERLQHLVQSLQAAQVIVVTVGNIFDFFLSHAENDIAPDVPVAPKFFRIWQSEDVGVRGTVSKNLKSAGAEFRMATYSETIIALSRLRSAILAINPDAFCIFTLSPVPFDSAVGLEQSLPSGAMELDCVSKSTLRAALHEFFGSRTRSDPNLFYFPSFEIVRWIGAMSPVPAFGSEDAASRHVSATILNSVYHYFLLKFGVASSTLPSSRA